MFCIAVLISDALVFCQQTLPASVTALFDGFLVAVLALSLFGSIAITVHHKLRGDDVPTVTKELLASYTAEKRRILYRNYFHLKARDENL